MKYIKGCVPGAESHSGQVTKIEYLFIFSKI